MSLLRKPRQRRDKGYIFVMALVVIAGLLALLAMMVADQRAESQATINRHKSTRVLRTK